jgi:pyruvate/2-oxoglutarate dehydrogenase complex dihydrolipoamide acyltransferase (E2) component
VGKVIALLAEEGDDISNLEAPKEEESSSSKQESASSSKEESSPPPASSSKSSSESSFQSSSSTESPKAPKAHSHGHPTHSRPLFPSVMRLLVEHGVEDAEKIKGTGIRGMLTKGDVLAFLGKASGPLGTYKESKKEAPKAVGPKKDAPKVSIAIFTATYMTLILSSATGRCCCSHCHP